MPQHKRRYLREYIMSETVRNMLKTVNLFFNVKGREKRYDGRAEFFPVHTLAGLILRPLSDLAPRLTSVRRVVSHRPRQELSRLSRPRTPERSLGAGGAPLQPAGRGDRTRICLRSKPSTR